MASAGNDEDLLGGRVTRPRRGRARRLGARSARARRRRARLAAAYRSRRPAIRRIAIALALLIVVLFPLPVLASDTPPRQQPACQGDHCRAEPVQAQRWATPLTGTWSAGTGPGSTGDGGTVPAVGQAYVAVGGGAAVVGLGLDVTGYNLSSGKQLWQTTLDAPIGTAIISVRAWPDVITVGLLAPDGRSRTEAVLNATNGTQLRRYPAAVFGGAVAASRSTTVIVGSNTVTSYDNATGGIRWRHTSAAGEAWQTDGQRLYMAESAGGYLGSAPVTALRVIDLRTGTQRPLSAPLGRPFSGTLATAADGAVLFASPDGVTAYSGSTGGVLWTESRAVPEGTDPLTGLVDITLPTGALAEVDPLTGTVHAEVPPSVAAGGTGLYVVRNGVAFGLDGGANGTAWGYDMAKGQVTWTSQALPWPHFFSDLSGLGGSAAVAEDVVVVTTCARLASSTGMCAEPKLVAFTVRP